MEARPVVYELPRPLFGRVAPLYAAAWFDQPCYDAVFEGRQEARVFVDDATAPKAALMCRTYEYYPAGAADAGLRTFVRDAPEEAGVFQDFYGYAPLTPAWERALREDLPLEVIPRRNFQWRAGTPAPDWRDGLPADARIAPLDRALAARVDRDLHPVPFIEIDWEDYDRYARHGFGFCLLVGRAIACAVYAIAVSATHAMVNVFTAARFRRRGFATRVSARFIVHCLEHGHLPVWDCDRVNVASAATAARLGFVEARPFVELGMPERSSLQMSRGVWARGEPSPEGVVAWRRAFRFSRSNPPTDGF